MDNIIVKRATILSVITISLIVIYIGFFDFKPFAKYFTAVKLFCLIPLVYFSFRTIMTDQSTFSNPLRLILFSIFFSFIPAYLSWDQSILHTLISTAYYYCFLLYFFLIRTNISIKTVKNILLSFTTLYVVLYLFQFINYQTAYFGHWNSFQVSRGIIRIIFPGEGFIFFGFVFFFHQAIEEKRNLKSWLILFVICLIIFMQVTRQYLLAIGIVCLIGLLKNSKLYLKILSVFLILISVNIYKYSTHPMIAGIREHQEADIELKEDYIRVVAGEFFLTEMSPDLLSSIFGNGMPYSRSSYGQYVEDVLVEEENFYFFDLGLIGGYSLFGVLFVIGHLYIGFILLKIKLPPNAIYLKYYFIIIFVMSITSSSVLGCGYTVPSMLVLYLIHKYSVAYKTEGNSNQKKVVSTERNLQ